MQNELIELHCQQTLSERNNISEKERYTISTLYFHDLLIRSADKGGGGGAVVLINKSLYLQINRNMLSDAKTYKWITFNPTIKFQDELHTLLCDGISLGIFSQKELDFLGNRFPKLETFRMGGWHFTTHGCGMFGIFKRHKICPKYR